MTTLEKRIDQYNLISIYIVACIAMLDMAIWFINPSWFTILIPQSATMKFNTALLFFASALVLSDCCKSYSWQSRLRSGLSAGIVLISGLTLLAWLTQSPLFLDELFVADPLTAPENFPGRMSQMTAFLFLLMGVALLSRHQLPRMSEVLAVGINLIALISLYEFSLDFQSLYAVEFFETVSVHTALSFVFLGVVLILSLREGQIRHLVIMDNVVGLSTRLLLPLSLIIPTAMGWIILNGYQSKLYELSFAIVLFIISTATLQLIMALLYAITLKRWFDADNLNQQQAMEKERQQLELEKIRQIHQHKTQFLSQLGHDMVSPLSGILLVRDITLRKRQMLTDEQFVKQMNKIGYYANNMLELIDDIVMINRMELDEVVGQFEISDFVACCQAYYDVYTEYNDLGLDMENHQFSLIVPQTPVYLKFDPKMIRRLLSNLVNNARKYSPGGGMIKIHIATDDKHTTLSISDEGIGIPVENLETLFDRFQRADNVGHIKGYGLGLAIVQQVVKLHQATIEVESTVGSGSTFTVTFPNLTPEELAGYRKSFGTAGTMAGD